MDKRDYERFMLPKVLKEAATRVEDTDLSTILLNAALRIEELEATVTEQLVMMSSMIKVSNYTHLLPSSKFDRYKA